MKEIHLPTKATQDDIKQAVDNIESNNGLLVDIDDNKYRPVMGKELKNINNSSVQVDGMIMCVDEHYVYTIKIATIYKLDKHTLEQVDIAKIDYITYGDIVTGNQEQNFGADDTDIYGILYLNSAAKSFIIKINKETLGITYGPYHTQFNSGAIWGFDVNDSYIYIAQYRALEFHIFDKKTLNWVKRVPQSWEQAGIRCHGDYLYLLNRVNNTGVGVLTKCSKDGSIISTLRFPTNDLFGTNPNKLYFNDTEIVALGTMGFVRVLQSTFTYITWTGASTSLGGGYLTNDSFISVRRDTSSSGNSVTVETYLLTPTTTIIQKYLPYPATNISQALIVDDVYYSRTYIDKMGSASWNISTVKKMDVIIAYEEVTV